MRKGLVGRVRLRALPALLCTAALLGLAPAAEAVVRFCGPTSYLVDDAFPRDAVVGDFNGDFDLDVAILSTGFFGASFDTISVMVGGPGGSFHPPMTVYVGETNDGLAVGDFNRDGDPDLVFTREGGRPLPETDGIVSILLGGAGATFAPPSDFGSGDASPRAVAVGDFNRDSDPDLAVVNRGCPDCFSPTLGSVAVLLGGAGGGFSAPHTYYFADFFPTLWRATDVTVGDFDADLDPDLAVTALRLGESGGGVALFLGGPGGSFAWEAVLPVGGADGVPHAMATGDFNGDSDSDLAVAHNEFFGSADAVSVMLGGSGASFGPAIDFAAGPAPNDVAVADVNGDSDPDLAVANQARHDNVSVLLGGPGGSFGGPLFFPVAHSAQSVTAADFNQDSQPDLVVANGSPHSPSLPVSLEVSILLNATATVPALSINDVTVAEGDRGTRDATFTVSLADADPFCEQVTVDFATADGTASAPDDYTSASGTVTFDPGETEKEVTIQVVGDVLDEPDETFFVELSNPVNATLSDDQGLGTIIDAQAPIAAHDSYVHYGVDTPLVVPAPGVLANDTDVDGDPLTARKITDPDDGTLTLNADGSFSYQPVFPGVAFDVFSYVANDGTADSNPAVVMITVLPGCNGQPPTIVGTNESETLIGTPGDDVIDARGGDDKLLGGGGNDVLCGGPGDDQLNADAGDDYLNGGPGNDLLNADRGDDTLRGGDDDDTLHGDQGIDALSGGPGSSDTCHGDDGEDTLDRDHGCERVSGVP